MINNFKAILKCLLGAKLIDFIIKHRMKYINKKGSLSYSQEGEDRVLSSLLFKINGAENIKNGFYVDVGAHDPYRFSNTHIFYKQGWSGINIDAMPGSMISFNKSRPRDINLELGVGKMAGSLKYFSFNEPAINTFDENLAMARCNNVWHIKSTDVVAVLPLSDILNKYLPEGQSIDFFTVDVEGFDLEVLQSNDWLKFRPRVVLVETFGISFEDLFADPIVKYLNSVGYIAYSKTVNTTFFVDQIVAKNANIKLDNMQRANKKNAF